MTDVIGQVCSKLTDCSNSSTLFAMKYLRTLKRLPKVVQTSGLTALGLSALGLAAAGAFYWAAWYQPPASACANIAEQVHQSEGPNSVDIDGSTHSHDSVGRATPLLGPGTRLFPGNGLPTLPPLIFATQEVVSPDFAWSQPILDADSGYITLTLTLTPADGRASSIGDRREVWCSANGGPWTRLGQPGDTAGVYRLRLATSDFQDGSAILLSAYAVDSDGVAIASEPIELASHAHPTSTVSPPPTLSDQSQIAIEEEEAPLELLEETDPISLDRTGAPAEPTRHNSAGDHGPAGSGGGLSVTSPGSGGGGGGSGGPSSAGGGGGGSSGGGGGPSPSPAAGGSGTHTDEQPAPRIVAPSADPTVLHDTLSGINGAVVGRVIVVRGVSAVAWPTGAEVEVLHGHTTTRNLTVPPSASASYLQLAPYLGGSIYTAFPASLHNTPSGFIVLTIPPGDLSLTIWSKPEDPLNPSRQIIQWDLTVTSTSDPSVQFD